MRINLAICILLRRSGLLAGLETASNWYFVPPYFFSTTLGMLLFRTCHCDASIPFFPEIWFFFCPCHNFFPSFFCANNYYTSLLLIVCALRWYVKSPYRHFFLEDIANHARVTQKWHFLIRGRPNSHAPWPTRPKLGTNVAKGLSCDISVFFPFSGEPPLRYRAEKRWGHKFPWSRLFSALYLRGGLKIWGLTLGNGASH